MIQEDAIPESLIALAKDARYLEDVKRLLIPILGQRWWWFWTTREEEEADDDGNRNSSGNNHETVEMDAWYVSVILYVLLVVAKRGKTLGMEATGLQYATTTTTTRQQHGTALRSSPPRRSIVVSCSIATASLIYVLRRITLERTSSASQRMDALRGNRRRLAFEQQRQAMLQRAQQLQQLQQHQQEQSSSSSLSPTVSAAAAHGSGRRRLVEVFRQIVQSITKTLMSSTTVSTGGGPHDLSGQGSGGNFSIGMWCLRLYLAYYLVVDGRYPTWMHRIAGISLIQSSGNGASQKAGLVHRPESMRLVGLLMFVHASGIMAQQLSNSFIKWWVDRYPPNIISSQTSRLKFDWSESRENGEESNNVASLTDNGGGPSSSAHTTTTTTKRTTTLCAICQEHRKFPACPVACGHVFCWNCLQQGLANRPECPLCRAACRPQDVLPLYDYEPAARRSSTSPITAGGQDG